MTTCAKISTAQRVAALKALSKATIADAPWVAYRLNGESQYACCGVAVFHWCANDFQFPVEALPVSFMGDSALCNAKSAFAKFDGVCDCDFPMTVGEFKRRYANGPLKQCAASDRYLLANKHFNPRLLSGVLYAICSRENCIPTFRSYGNAAQLIYLCGDLGEALLCPLCPDESEKGE